MPVEYETQAELDYKAAVDDYLARYSEDVSKYGGDTDYIYIDRNRIPLLPGQRVRLLSDKYFFSVGRDQGHADDESRAQTGQSLHCNNRMHRPGGEKAGSRGWIQV